MYTRLLTNSSGGAVGTYQFDAYGNTTTHTGTTTPMQYAGQYKDDESGLYWMRARYYDPSTGQFVSRDPLAFSTGKPYSYVENDPIGGIDAAGLRRGPNLFERGAIVVHDALHGAADKFVDQHPIGAQQIVDSSAGFLSGLTMGNIDWMIPESAEGSWNHSSYFAGGAATGFVASLPLMVLKGGGAAKTTVCDMPEVSQAMNILPKPVVANEKLGNIVGNLYKGTENPARVGTGTTMDAVRHELSNATTVFGKTHSEKLENEANGLNSLLKKGVLNDRDSMVARSLLGDIHDALSTPRG